MALQVTSCTLKNRPDKLLDKGAGYFRERTNRGILRSCGRRKSAVELLEASKAQYVKSVHVLEQHQDLNHAAREQGNPSSSREKFPRCSKENEGDAHSFPRPYKRDRKLRYSIGACENIPHGVKAPARSRHSLKVSYCDQGPDLTSSLSAPHVSPTVDLRQAHGAMEGAAQTPEKLSIVSASQRFRHLVHSPAGKDSLHSSIDLPSDKMLRRQKAIHRSQSDLSSRHSRSSTDFSDLSSRMSRTSADLERFFNEMGLDKTVIDPLLRKQSRSFSDFDFLETMSSVGSPDARSNCSGVSKSEKTDRTGPEVEIHVPIGKTSIVERNARIIKWLCNVKKARNFAPSSDKASTK